MKYSPATSFNYSEAHTEDGYYHEEKTTTVTVKGFYLQATEVSNAFYREFMMDIKAKGDTTVYQSILPDTLVWREPLAYNEPYMLYYLRHPAYGEYPVVGITYAQCEKFCEWLTEKYHQNPKRKFKKVKFRLPSKHEWFSAAVYEPVTTKKEGKIYYETGNRLFPWHGWKLQNKDGKYKANYKVMDESSIHREVDTIMTVYGKKAPRTRLVISDQIYIGTTGTYESADVTAPITSYWSNELGFYNLAGNVEEFVSEYGITKGGSWNDPAFYLRNEVIEKYDSTKEATSSRGFRVAMEVIEE